MVLCRFLNERGRRQQPEVFLMVLCRYDFLHIGNSLKIFLYFVFPINNFLNFLIYCYF